VQVRLLPRDLREPFVLVGGDDAADGGAQQFAGAVRLAQDRIRELFAGDVLVLELRACRCIAGGC
jgi:hypothetical protein